MHSATTAGDLHSLPRPDLAAQYIAVRTTTRDLCAPLSAEDQMVQSMPDASPAKWHQAHTTWFFETFILVPHASGYRPFDERFQFLFNSYYKRLGGHPIRAQRGLWSRPSLEEVRRYREYVDEAMLRFLAGAFPPEVGDLVVLGCNHEQQHQELILTDIKHALWTNPLRPSYRSAEARAQRLADNTEQVLAPPLPAAGPTFALDQRPPSEPASLRWFEYGGGLHWVGHQGDSFCFDNELPRHQVFLPPFRFASLLVTNAEYLAFISDKGYERPELWLSEGWDTVNAQGWRAPFYWEQRDESWVVYTFDGEHPVNPAEPVCHVSYFEADAYARWAGARLATEFEWEVAASQSQVEIGPGDDGSINLLHTRRFHPAVAHFTRSDSHPAQLFGDVWEWTASQYLPYPGFRPAAGAVGEYNGKFMCNQFVLRGGSCATPADHIRAAYRNFFPPQARWQFSGIRLAK